MRGEGREEREEGKEEREEEKEERGGGKINGHLGREIRVKTCTYMFACTCMYMCIL